MEVKLNLKWENGATKGEMKSKKKKEAHKNNDLILENMHNMISQSGP